jgi:hypothetical protein
LMNIKTIWEWAKKHLICSWKRSDHISQIKIASFILSLEAHGKYGGKQQTNKFN